MKIRMTMNNDVANVHFTANVATGEGWD
ncbi:hypothetical protein OK016_14240 [Vibrio chagasii]|nr:hypothetical protein [Vibrio chagasii]